MHPVEQSTAALETLPARLYRDPAQFAVERHRIFERNWLLFACSEQLGKPGDYVAGQIAGWPVFAVRGEDGRVRAFHNVCRHRAAPLVAEGAGACGQLISCPYHAWSYRLDGQLQRARDFGAEVPARDLSLHAVDCDEWRGLVFIRIQRGGKSLLDWLGPIVELGADYPLERQYLFGHKVREVAADWKVYGENYLECYHCPVLHPGLSESIDLGRYQVDVYPEHQVVYQHSPKRAGGLTSGLYFFRFPCLMLGFYDWGSSIATLEPLGAGQLRHIHWCRFSDVGPEQAVDHRASAEWLVRIVTEDLEIVAGVQRNLNMGVYEKGLLSPKHESGVLAFQNMVREEMAGEPESALLEGASGRG